MPYDFSQCITSSLVDQLYIHQTCVTEIGLDLGQFSCVCVCMCVCCLCLECWWSSACMHYRLYCILHLHTKWQTAGLRSLFPTLKHAALPPGQSELFTESITRPCALNPLVNLCSTASVGKEGNFARWHKCLWRYGSTLCDLISSWSFSHWLYMVIKNAVHTQRGWVYVHFLIKCDAMEWWELEYKRLILVQISFFTNSCIDLGAISGLYTERPLWIETFCTYWHITVKSGGHNKNLAPCNDHCTMATLMSLYMFHSVEGL